MFLSKYTHDKMTRDLEAGRHTLNDLNNYSIQGFIREDDIKAAEDFLQKESKKDWLNVADKTGHTVLHIALINRNSKMVKLLLQNGADPNVLVGGISADLPDLTQHFPLLVTNSEEGLSPLQIAINGNDLESFKLLLADKRIKVNLKNKKGHTALHYAAKYTDKIEMTALLIGHRADLSIVTPVLKQNALIIAVIKGHYEIASLLLQHGADPNAKDEEGHTILHHAVHEDQSRMIELLLNQPNIRFYEEDAGHFSPFFRAISSKRKECAEVFLKHSRFDVNKKDLLGFVPLYIAIISKDDDFIKLLLQYGANPGGMINQLVDLHKLTSLYNKTADPSLEYIEHIKTIFAEEEERRTNLMSQEFAKLNSNDKTAHSSIHVAASLGDLTALRLALKQDDKPNAKNSEGDTALHIAVEKNNFQCVEVLIGDQAVDLNVKNKEGETPLHLAVKNKNSEMVKLLVKQASPNVRDKNGNTCLHCAAQAGDTQMVNLLIQYGANPHQQNDQGDTALHEAVRQGSVEMARILLQCGVNPAVRNQVGQNAMGLVKEDQNDLKRLLNKYFDIHENLFSANSSATFAQSGSEAELGRAIGSTAVLQQ